MGELSIWAVWFLVALVIGKSIQLASNWTLAFLCLVFTVWWFPVVIHVPQVWLALFEWRF